MSSDLTRQGSELILKFARIEHALKMNGFHRGNGRAKPDWCRFAKSVAVLFEEPANENLAEAIDYIVANPPQKEFIRNSQPVMETSPLDMNPKSNLVLGHVRQVRNNLVHGAKFSEHGDWHDPERSSRLFRHSLTILEACFNAMQVKGDGESRTGRFENHQSRELRATRSRITVQEI